PFRFRTIDDPSCNTGDRVLVSKFAYTQGPLGNPVRPLDVVVFKFPEGPQKNFVPMNYIKRCIGLPGHTVGIWHGDIYIAENLSYEPRSNDDRDRRRDTRKNEKASLLEAYNPKVSSDFKIMRKPPAIMLAMRRPVYDNNHRAETLTELNFPERWAPEKRGSGAFADPPVPEFRTRRSQAEGDGWWKED